MIRSNTCKGELCFSSSSDIVVSFKKIVDKEHFSAFFVDSVHKSSLRFNPHQESLLRSYFYTERDIKNKRNIPKNVYNLYYRYLSRYTSKKSWETESI